MRFGGNAGLEIYVTAVFHFLAGRFVVAFVLPARRVARFLHVQIKINLVRQHLDMTLRLHSAAHHAECFPRFAIFHHKPRDDGVKWTLAGCINVRVSRLHRKKFSPVLKHETESRHHDAAAHAVVITLNQRNHVPFIIGRAQVNRVAIVDLSSGNTFARVIWVD